MFCVKNPAGIKKKVLKQNKQHTETLTSFQKSAPLIDKAERGRLKRLPAASWSPLHAPHSSCLPPAALVPHVPGRGNAPGTWIWRDVSTPPWGQVRRAGLHPSAAQLGSTLLKCGIMGELCRPGERAGLLLWMSACVSGPRLSVKSNLTASLNLVVLSHTSGAHSRVFIHVVA